MGEALDQLLVPFEQFLGAGGEVLVCPNTGDLGGQRVHDQRIDAGPLDSRHRFGLLGQLVGESDGREWTDRNVPWSRPQRSGASRQSRTAIQNRFVRYPRFRDQTVNRRR